MPDNLQTKTTKLINYAKSQLSSKGVTSTATTLRGTLDDISDIVTGSSSGGDCILQANSQTEFDALVIDDNAGKFISKNYGDMGLYELPSQCTITTSKNVSVYDGKTPSGGYAISLGNKQYLIKSGYVCFNIGAGSSSVTSGNAIKINERVPIDSYSAPFYDSFEVFSDSIFTTNYITPCLVEGTLITLANGATKKIEDITYNDDLLVWDFDNGVFASAKPLWIKVEETANEYNCSTFSDGTKLNIVNHHRIFDVNNGEFVYADSSDTPMGTRTFKEDNSIIELIDIQTIHKNVKFYNIITNYHMNCFANGILTSCRLSNLYPIKDMKYIKSNRDIIPFNKFNIPYDFYVGLRIGEQPADINRDNAVTHGDKTINDYVNRILKKIKDK